MSARPAQTSVLLGRLSGFCCHIPWQAGLNAPSNFIGDRRIDMPANSSPRLGNVGPKMFTGYPQFELFLKFQLREVSSWARLSCTVLLACPGRGCSITRQYPYEQNCERQLSSVLIADDSAEDRLLLCGHVRGGIAQNSVGEVSDGSETIAYLKGHDEFSNRKKYPMPDLLLLDLKMPVKGRVRSLEMAPCTAIEGAFGRGGAHQFHGICGHQTRAGFGRGPVPGETQIVP